MLKIGENRSGLVGALRVFQIHPQKLAKYLEHRLKFTDYYKKEEYLNCEWQLVLKLLF